MKALNYCGTVGGAWFATFVSEGKASYEGYTETTL